MKIPEGSFPAQKELTLASAWYTQEGTDVTQQSQTH